MDSSWICSDIPVEQFEEEQWVLPSDSNTPLSSWGMSWDMSAAAAAVAAQLFPVQGLICFQVLARGSIISCNPWCKLTDSLAAPSVPGALQQCAGPPEVSSTLWFTPLEKHDHLRIFWSRQVQTPREDHVPSDWEWRSPERSQQRSHFLLPARLLWDISAIASAG